MEQTIPTPKVRQTVRVTEHGGYNWRCPDSGLTGPAYNGWANNRDIATSGICGVHHVGDRPCQRPRAEAEVVECPPRVIEGRVTSRRDSITGQPLVYVKQPGERYAECVAWSEYVLACEVLA